MTLSLKIEQKTWSLTNRFTISRGSKTEIHAIIVTLTGSGVTGRGEAVPYPRFGGTVKQAIKQIRELKETIENGLTRARLQQLMPAGAARNAIDCALWDFEAKQSGRPVTEQAGLPPLVPVTTAYTISLDNPDAMHAAAQRATAYPILKIKLGRGHEDLDRLKAVRHGAPGAQLIVDANEGWTPDELPAMLAACDKAGVTVIEQPLPATNDEQLATIKSPVPLCADESCHDRLSLAALRGKYQMINIKLDKTGGLTEALLLAHEARRQGFAIMAGCMVASSLAVAPAMLLAQSADFVDLDGALLLAQDHHPALHYDGATLSPPDPALWG